MLIFILAPFLLGLIRKKRVGRAVRSRLLIPLYLMELVYIACQVMALAGNYSAVAYARWIQAGFLFSLLFPIIGCRLYARAIIGSALTLAGTALNRLAMAANGGYMPVKPTLSKLTGYYKESALDLSGDAVHRIMNGGTKLKALCDFIDTGFSVMSVGDVLIHLFTSIVIFGVILYEDRREV